MSVILLSVNFPRNIYLLNRSRKLMDQSENFSDRITWAKCASETIFSFLRFLLWWWLCFFCFCFLFISFFNFSFFSLLNCKELRETGLLLSQGDFKRNAGLQILNWNIFWVLYRIMGCIFKIFKDAIELLFNATYIIGCYKWKVLSNLVI